MKNVCVFCGGVDGVDQKFIDFSFLLGEHIAKNGHRLIYGGGVFGLMGGVFRGVSSAGGKILGVIPEFLMQKERGDILDRADSETIITQTLDERLAIFFEKADIILVLPGGIGTLNELIQALELKKHQKLKAKIYIINLDGFYHHFLSQLDIIVDKKLFSREKIDTLFTILSEPIELFTLLQK